MKCAAFERSWRVLTWLNAHGASFGFKRTVSSEPWHWEWWGGGPGGGPCGQAAFAGESLGLEGQSYPVASKGAATVEVGQTVTGWIKLRNVGKETWRPGVVWLAPIPRDQASPFASASWASPSRISSVTADVPPGSVGEFSLDLTGSAPGELLLELGWVAEGITWFSDGPTGGGPKDGYFTVKVNVLPASEPPPDLGESTDPGSTGEGGADAFTSGQGGFAPEEPELPPGGEEGGAEDSLSGNGLVQGSCASLAAAPVRGTRGMLGAVAALALARLRRISRRRVSEPGGFPDEPAVIEAIRRKVAGAPG